MGSEEMIFELHSRAIVGENHEISFHVWDIVQNLIPQQALIYPLTT